MKPKKEKADKILIILLLLLNGNNPFFNFLYLIPTSISYFIWTGLIILFYGVFKKSMIIHSTIIYYIIFGLGLFFLQSNHNPIIGRIVQFFFVVLVPYLIFKFIDIKSLRYFPIFLKYIIIFSIVLWIPSNIIYHSHLNINTFLPSLLFLPDNPIVEESTHILFYNFRGFDEHVYFLFRNSGFYWEPGAFAGTIIMTYILFIFTKSNFSRKESKNIHFWLIVGLISTFSTTGLIILPILYFIGINYTKNKGVKNQLKHFLIYLPIIILVTFFMFKLIPTLGDKISYQFEAAMLEKKGSQNNRIGSMILLSYSIMESPYLGHGIFNNINEYWDKAFTFNGEDGRNANGNGMFLYVVRAGIPFFLLLCFFWWKSFFRFTNSAFYSFYFLVILLLLLQGEAWLNYPFIYFFMFFKKIKYENLINNSYL